MKFRNIVLIRHKVSNFRRWKEVFEARAETRKARGCKGEEFFRSADDAREIVILLEWNDLERARRFITSEDAREAMAQAGVSDMPDIYFLRRVDTAA